MSDFLEALLDQVNRFSDETGCVLEDWVEEVVACNVLERSLADTLTWLKDGKGPNSEALRGHVRLLQQRAWSYRRSLGQQAFMLWGINLPYPKNLKVEE